MPITVDYGNIASLLPGAYAAGRTRTSLQAAEIQARMLGVQADQMNALARYAAIQQQGQEGQADRATRASIASADNQTRYDLAEMGDYAQAERDYRLAGLQTQRDERDFQRQALRDDYLMRAREDMDLRNDARTMERERQMNMIRQGAPLTFSEKQEGNNLENANAEIDRRLAAGDLTAEQSQQMRQRIEPRLAYLRDRNQSWQWHVQQDEIRQRGREIQFQVVDIPDPNSTALFQADGTPQRYPDNHPVDFLRGRRMFSGLTRGVWNPNTGTFTPINPAGQRSPVTFNDFSREVERIRLDSPNMSQDEAHQRARQNVEAFQRMFANERANQQQQQQNNPELQEAAATVQRHIENAPNAEARDALTGLHSVLRGGVPLSQMNPAQRQAFNQAMARIPANIARQIMLPNWFLGVQNAGQQNAPNWGNQQESPTQPGPINPNPQGW